MKVRHEDRILKGDKPFHEVFEYLLALGASPHHRPKGELRDNTSLEEYLWEIELLAPPNSTLLLGDRKVSLYPEGTYTLRKGAPRESGLKRINIRGSLREGNSSGRFYVAYLEGLRTLHGGSLAHVPGMGRDGRGGRFFWIPSRESRRRNGDYFQGVPLNRAPMKRIPTPNLWNFESAFNRPGPEGGVPFRNGKKPLAFLHKVLQVMGGGEAKEGIYLDYFAGSGSFAHALMELNAQDGGHRTFVAVEMGQHFETVLKKRLLRGLVSREWHRERPKEHRVRSFGALMLQLQEGAHTV